MKLFQVIKQNPNGTIVIEFPIYRNKTIPHPIDNNGNLLAGGDLIQHINMSVHAEQSLEPPLDTPDYGSSAAFQEQFGLIDNSGNTVLSGGIPV